MEPKSIVLNMNDVFKHRLELREGTRLVETLPCLPSDSFSLLKLSSQKLFESDEIMHPFIDAAFCIFAPKRITLTKRKKKMEMRDYQRFTAESTEDHLLLDNKAVIALPQGGGKSVLISHHAQQYSKEDKTVVVMTNFSELIPQLARHLDTFNIEYNIVKAGQHKYSETAKVWLIMEQSFHEDKRVELNIECDILIKDEFHVGAGQKRYEDIISHLKPKKIIGFTATPYDEKGFIMHGVSVDEIITSCTARELMKNGYLTPLRYFVPRWSEEIDYSEVSSTGTDYNGKELDDIINTNKHTELVIRSMNQMNAKTRKTLVYASSIEHANDINKALLKAGYSTEVVHSKMSAEHNKNAIAMFKNQYSKEASLITEPDDMTPNIMCLVSCMTLTTGFDAPLADLLVLLRPTKVWRLYSQIALRVGRIYEGKKYGDILDLAQCLREHGFAEDPLPYINKGMKKELAKAKEQRAIEFTKQMAKEEPTEISIETINLYLEEIRQKVAKIDTMPMADLLSLWDGTTDSYTIIHIGYEMARRMNGANYKSSDLIWAHTQWDEFISEFYEYKLRIIKAMKTRIKNIVREKKKISSIYYFPAFLRQNPPYNGEFDFSSFKM